MHQRMSPHPAWEPEKTHARDALRTGPAPQPYLLTRCRLRSSGPRRRAWLSAGCWTDMLRRCHGPARASTRHSGAMKPYRSRASTRSSPSPRIRVPQLSHAGRDTLHLTRAQRLLRRAHRARENRVTPQRMVRRNSNRHAGVLRHRERARASWAKSTLSTTPFVRAPATACRRLMGPWLRPGVRRR